MFSHIDTGKKGEIIAKNHLMGHGYRIVETNWHFGHLEIDIIAQKEETIIFCEVKTRSSSRMGEPETFVSRQKQQFLIRAAHHYVIKKNIDKEVRFDIISILLQGEKPSVKHIQEAFTPRW